MKRPRAVPKHFFDWWGLTYQLLIHTKDPKEGQWVFEFNVSRRIIITNVPTLKALHLSFEDKQDNTKHYEIQYGAELFLI